VNEQRREQYALESALQTPAEREQNNAHRRELRNELDAEERAQVNEQRREQYALESALQTPAEREQNNAHRRELRNELDAEERAQVNEQRREQYALESALQTPAEREQNNAHRRELRNELDAEERAQNNHGRRETYAERRARNLGKTRNNFIRYLARGTMAQGYVNGNLWVPVSTSLVAENMEHINFESQCRASCQTCITLERTEGTTYRSLCMPLPQIWLNPIKLSSYSTHMFRTRSIRVQSVAPNREVERTRQSIVQVCYRTLLLLLLPAKILQREPCHTHTIFQPVRSLHPSCTLYFFHGHVPQLSISK